MNGHQEPLEPSEFEPLENEPSELDIVLGASQFSARCFLTIKILNSTPKPISWHSDFAKLKEKWAIKLEEHTRENTVLEDVSSRYWHRPTLVAPYQMSTSKNKD